jgi:hypothetical protein
LADLYSYESLSTIATSRCRRMYLIEVQLASVESSFFALVSASGLVAKTAISHGWCYIYTMRQWCVDLAKDYAVPSGWRPAVVVKIQNRVGAVYSLGHVWEAAERGYANAMPENTTMSSRCTLTLVPHVVVSTNDLLLFRPTRAAWNKLGFRQASRPITSSATCDPPRPGPRRQLLGSLLVTLHLAGPLRHSYGFKVLVDRTLGYGSPGAGRCRAVARRC